MALVLPPEFWSTPISDPKRKFKFFVQFGDKSLIDEVYPKHSYMWMIKSVTKPKPSLDTKEASDAETRTWFGYIPDPNKRNLGTVSWAPIQIKFVNPATRQERTNYSFKSNEYKPPDIEHPPAVSVVADLDHFFSRIIEESDSAFAGGTAGKELKWSNMSLTTRQDVVAAYRDSIKNDNDALQAFTRKSLSQQITEADPAGFKMTKDNTQKLYSLASTAMTLENKFDCKSSIDQFMRASCVFIKYFGEIKIYDMINNSPGAKSSQTQEEIASAPTTLTNGYWTLRNPWIKSIDFGNNEYSSDDLQEYTLELAYESARYVSGDV